MQIPQNHRLVTVRFASGTFHARIHDADGKIVYRGTSTAGVGQAAKAVVEKNFGSGAADSLEAWDHPTGIEGIERAYLFNLRARSAPVAQSQLFDNLVDAVTQGSAEDALGAIHLATLGDLEKLRNEWDIEAIAEMMETEEGKNLAITLDKIIGAKRELVEPVSSEENTVLRNELFFDEDLQMREGFDHDHIEEMRAHLRSGGELEPLDVYRPTADDVFANGQEGRLFYIGDGNHRGKAYYLENRERIPVRIHEGGRRACLIHALGANAEHNALRRTNADKRRAVRRALSDLEDKSLREIAEVCKVSHEMVRKIKGEGSENGGGTTKKEPSQKPPEQLFMSLFFERKKGWLPGLRRAIDNSDFATIPADKWGDLAADLRDLLGDVEKRAGLNA